MAIPALNSSVGSRGSLMLISDITSLNSLLETFDIVRGTHRKRANLGKWIERAMMSRRTLNRFNTRQSNTASSL